MRNILIGGINFKFRLDASRSLRECFGRMIRPWATPVYQDNFGLRATVSECSVPFMVLSTTGSRNEIVELMTSCSSAGSQFGLIAPLNPKNPKESIRRLQIILRYGRKMILSKRPLPALIGLVDTNTTNQSDLSGAQIPEKWLGGIILSGDTEKIVSFYKQCRASHPRTPIIIQARSSKLIPRPIMHLIDGVFVRRE